MRPALLVLALLVSAPGAKAASQDGIVEWLGVSHVAWQDRLPLCPMDGEAFVVRFQAFLGDLTSARVHVDDGSVTTVNAVRAGRRGPFRIWQAVIPATSAPRLTYHLELTDGADTDFYGPQGMSSAPPLEGFVIDSSTLEHAPLGATMVTGGAVFRVWSPTRASAHVRGEFNGWSLAHPMARVEEDFVTFVPAATLGQQYKYFFDSNLWNTDPRARRLNPTGNLNAYLLDPSTHAWQAEDFQTPPLQQMVVYQLHVGTFAGYNDPFGSTPFPSGYLDVAQRVSHLAELGVNAVLLNPITEFPGDVSAGYNPITQFSPEWRYGTPDALKTMIDAFHAAGIAVLLDVVWNHFSFSDNFLWYYDGTQIYFDDPAVETPWGSQADFDRERVRDYFADSALQWLQEYRFDGFRADATAFMNIPPQDASGWSLMQRINDEIDAKFAERVVIAEQLPDNDWVTRPTPIGGAGFDSQYHDAFTDQLRQEIFDAAFGSPDMWRIRDIVNGSGPYLSGSKVVNYLELHDEAWPTSGGQRIVKTIDPTAPHDDPWAQGRFKLGQGLVLLAPGVPALLQGSEWLESIDWGPEATGRIDWSKKTTYAPVFAYWRDVIALRTGNPSLYADASRQVTHLNESGDVIAFRRWIPNGDQFLVIANFSNTDYASYRVGLPQAGAWDEVINSQAAAYGGSGSTNPAAIESEPIAQDGLAQSGALDLAKMALVVLRWADRPVAVDPAGPSQIRLAAVAPNPVRSRATLAYFLSRESHAKLVVYDVRGRRVDVLVDRVLPPGEHLAVWDSRGLPRGVYFYELSTGDHRVVRKAVLSR